MALLEVQNLHTHFKTDAGVARAVDGISFDIKKGECVALVGESGCGKSVTSFTIMRLLPMPPAFIPTGQVLFKDRDLARLSEAEMCKIRGREIGMIFQEPQSALNPVFTVGEQITEAFLTHHPQTLGAAKRGTRRRINARGRASPIRNGARSIIHINCRAA